MLSLVIPLYCSQENIPDLLQAVSELARKTPLEAVFVDDGSPDRSAEILHHELDAQDFPSRLIELSRNFGSFSAIAAGLAHGSGDCFAMLSADLQEPPELMLDFVERLSSGNVDVVVGQRITRQDPWLSRALSNLFWKLFRRFAVKDIPSGGVDTFGCTRQVRDGLIALPEVDSSLVSLLFWMGFRRQTVPFVRRERTAGKSSWSFKKKVDYAIYSFFNFTDLPIRLLIYSGAFASVLALLVGVIVLWARLAGWIQVPGYTPLAILISFYGGVTTFGLGIVGQYIWLTLQNARRRPNYIVRAVSSFGPDAKAGRATAP